MKQTTNFHLNKPDSTDYYNVQDSNNNMDIIDAEIKEAKDKADQAFQLASNPVKVNGHTVESDVPANAKFTDTVYVHPNSGVSAGAYRKVTVNASGHVTSGENPTLTIPEGGTGATTAAAALTALGAAPSGFGLGSTAATGYTDCNSMINTGWYMGSGLVNAPDTNWYMVEVIQHNSTWTYQRIIGFNQGLHKVFERLQMNGSWTAWKNTTVQYGTTDMTVGTSLLDTGSIYIVYE